MSRVTLLRLASTVVLLSACDRQVDRHFQGDSLLRIEGNVVSTRTEAQQLATR